MAKHWQDEAASAAAKVCSILISHCTQLSSLLKYLLPGPWALCFSYYSWFNGKRPSFAGLLDLYASNNRQINYNVKGHLCLWLDWQPACVHDRHVVFLNVSNQSFISWGLEQVWVDGGIQLVYGSRFILSSPSICKLFCSLTETQFPVVFPITQPTSIIRNMQFSSKCLEAAVGGLYAVQSKRVTFEC